MNYRMEYPTKEEASRFTRDLTWDERFEVLSQGYHRGVVVDQCYSMNEFATRVSLRNPKDPTGGVRSLNGGEVTKWLCEVVGDEELSKLLDKVFKQEVSMSEKMDIIRVILNSRMNQYYEVLEEDDGR